MVDPQLVAKPYRQVIPKGMDGNTEEGIGGVEFLDAIDLTVELLCELACGLFIITEFDCLLGFGEGHNERPM